MNVLSRLIVVLLVGALAVQPVVAEAVFHPKIQLAVNLSPSLFTEQAMSIRAVPFAQDALYWFWTRLLHHEGRRDERPAIADAHVVTGRQAGHPPKLSELFAFGPQERVHFNSDGNEGRERLFDESPEAEKFSLLGFPSQMNAAWVGSKIPAKVRIHKYAKLIRNGQTQDLFAVYLENGNVEGGRGRVQLRPSPTAGKWIYEIFVVSTTGAIQTLTMERSVESIPTPADIASHLKKANLEKPEAKRIPWSIHGSGKVGHLDKSYVIDHALRGDTIELYAIFPDAWDAIDRYIKSGVMERKGFAKLRNSPSLVYLKVGGGAPGARSAAKKRSAGDQRSRRFLIREKIRVLFDNGFGPQEELRFSPGVEPATYAQAGETSSWNFKGNWLNAVISPDGTRLAAATRLPEPAPAVDDAAYIVEYVRDPASGALSGGRVIGRSDPTGKTIKRPGFLAERRAFRLGSFLYYTLDGRITFTSVMSLQAGLLHSAFYLIHQRPVSDHAWDPHIELPIGEVPVSDRIVAYSEYYRPFPEWKPEISPALQRAHLYILTASQENQLDHVSSLVEMPVDLENGQWNQRYSWPIRVERFLRNTTPKFLLLLAAVFSSGAWSSSQNLPWSFVAGLGVAGAFLLVFVTHIVHKRSSSPRPDAHVQLRLSA